MATNEERRLQRRADALEAELNSRRSPSQRQADVATASTERLDGSTSATDLQVAAVREAQARRVMHIEGPDGHQLAERELKRRLIAEAFRQGGGQ